jgi:hypothetical protein
LGAVHRFSDGIVLVPSYVALAIPALRCLYLYRGDDHVIIDDHIYGQSTEFGFTAANSQILYVLVYGDPYRWLLTFWLCFKVT